MDEDSSDILENKFLVIKFKDLITNSENVLREICSFSNISFDKKMLDIDLSKSNFNRWKSDYSEKEQALICRKLKREIQLLGYSL